MSPLVSVAMATCNGARFLREQLESIYAQTYSAIEVVVSDDQSTDETPAILREYERTRGLKFEINDTRLGVTKNFERTVRRCSGEFIALADQDDIWLPEKIERLVANIGESSLICSDAQLCDDRGVVFAPSFYRYARILVPPQSLARQWSLVANFVTGCATLFRRGLLDEALPIPTGAPIHDWWFAIVAARQKGVRFLDEPLLLYRQHDNNEVGVVKGPRMVTRGGGPVWRLLRQYRARQRQWALDNLRRLEGIAMHPIFDVEDRQLIGELSRFWGGITRAGLHWKSACLLWRRRKLLVPEQGDRTAFIRALFTLIG